LNSKIIVGIIVAIVIVVGIGYGANMSQDTSNEITSRVPISQQELTEDDGKKITLELTDSVTAVGRP